MLIGQFSSRVDEKGRVAVPKKLRQELGEKLIITQGYERSLIVVAQHAWQELIAGTGDKPFIIGSARDTSRFLFGSANEVELDTQGRFVIPPYLREFGTITDTAIFLGLGRYVEVWAEKTWKEYRQYLDKNITTIAQDLARLNIDT